jgi:hypothetical protein
MILSNTIPPKHRCLLRMLGWCLALAAAGCGGDDSAGGGGAPDATPAHDAAGTSDAANGAEAGNDATVTTTPDAGADAGGHFTVTLSDASVVSTHAQRAALGFRFGYVDGVMGAVNEGDAGYVFFASGHTALPEAGTCTGPAATPDTQGAYRIGVATDVITQNFGCRALIANSGDGVPDGSVLGAYDRDYVGGGPVLSVTSGTSHALVLIYHSEFHWGPTCNNAPCFYGTLGMAISVDGGATFTKLGEIIQPAISRPAWIGAHPAESLSIGAGPLVLGDDNGQPVDPATASTASTYVYVFFDDFDPTNAAPCANAQCLTVARAPLQDVIDAAFGAAGAKPSTGLFSKYHAGDPAGPFTSPAASGSADDATAGGHSTYVVSNAFEASVLFDRPMGKFLLAYKSGGLNPIQLRTSSNVMSWPAAEVVPAMVEEDAGVRYPSLVGELPNAEVGGPQPYLFYTNGLDDWATSTFMSRRVLVSPTP